MIEEILDVLLDALLDSLKVLAFAFIIYFILSFCEDKVSNLLKKHKKSSPIIGALSGLIPQCGVSVVAADLYLSSHITMGCLLAVFLSCSDEALPILLTGGKKALYVIPLLLIKFIYGFSVGFLIDLIFRNKNKKKEKFLHLNEKHEDLEESQTGCCNHPIIAKESGWKEHLLHPLLHSLKIFAYVLVVNIIFGIVIYYITEERLTGFISANTYLTPLFTALVGIIPNCASSVLITTLFIEGGLPFGAMVTGLCVNAGLGLVYLMKSRKNLKNTLLIIGLLLLFSIIIGYLIMLVMMLF